MTGPAASPLRSPNLILALLLLAYIFNFSTAKILGILAGPIIADLKLTDAEFGAIAGWPSHPLFVLGCRWRCSPIAPAGAA